MKYEQSSIGRLLVVKLEHGDDLLASLKQLLIKENISSAVMLMIGALQKSSLVVGPQISSVPPDPVWKHIDEAHEIVGMATAFLDDNGEIKIHLHASLGRGEQSFTGCIRKDTHVYLVVEVIVFELIGPAIRTQDELTGINMLGFKDV